MANLKYIGKNILNHDLILKKGNVSGSASSTGSFGNLNISSDASITGDMVVGGKLTAEQFHTEITSASIIFASGSTIFGDTSDDTHEFTGSLKVTETGSFGNVIASGDVSVTDHIQATRIGLGQTNTSNTSAVVIQDKHLEFRQSSGTDGGTGIVFSEQNLGDNSFRILHNGAGSGANNTLKFLATNFHATNPYMEVFRDGKIVINEHITGDGLFINGSATSTGSFGHLVVQGNITASGTVRADAFESVTGGNAIDFKDSLNITGNLTASGDLSIDDLTATGTVQAEQLTSTDDITATGIITSNERINIQATNARLSLGPNAASIGSPALHGGVIYQDSSISGASLGNISGFGATTSGQASNYFLLQLAGGNGMYMKVGNDGAITFPSAASFTVACDITANGNIVGDGATNIQSINHITASGNISGSLTSTGSFGAVNTSGKITSTGGVTVTGTSKFTAHRSVGQYIEMYPDGNGSNYLQAQGNIRFAPNLGTKMILHANGRLGINTTTDAGYQIDVNGTGRFSDTLEAPHFSGSQFTGIFNGALSGSAQIASNISGAFAVASASFAADILSNSSSFAARDTLSEATSSKILNGQLEFTNITASANISSSGNITGNILNVKTRVKAIGSSLEFAGDTLDFVDGNSINRLFKGTAGGSVEAYHAGVKRLETTSGGINVIGNITGSGHISMSLSSTGSFGRVSATTIGGHSPLSVDSITTFTNVITASSAVQLDGKVFIQTGSIEGDLHVRTNENLMRIGKSTSGLIVSGSEEVSRFATGSDGSIIDLGFTVTDEDGNVVLAGDGDGIHIDSNNYWYNNKYYKVGDGTNNFLNYDTQDGIRYKGEVTVQTGSFGGEMFINSPTGSMFIGKFTGGIPSSGSDNVSRFATGSDGSIIDLGFTTTDESGETVFLTTGDGIVRDDKNYWYTTGHFKIGNNDKSISWDTKNLTLTNVSASGDFFVQGDSYVQEYIYHKGDNDTYLRFAPNLVNLAAGGKSAIKYEASAGKVIINNSNANVDFHVMADDGEEILATDAANNRVGINTTTPGVALEVVGDISGSAQSTGSFGSLVVDGSSLDFSNVPTSDPGIAGRVWRDGTDLKISVG